jgi:hypothetical protein
LEKNNYTYPLVGLSWNSDFLKYIVNEYFPLLRQYMESTNEKYEYSTFKIEQIMEELKDAISSEEICEMYWKRLTRIIYNMKETGTTDNTLWNCITKLNRCKIKPEWRKWLTERDEQYDLKKAVFNELSPSALL